MKNKQKKWVIKVGSSLLSNSTTGLNYSLIDNLTKQIAIIAKKNIDIAIVSSGSIAEGVHRLKWQTRPKDIHKLQAAAAVGQTGLVHAYESSFSKYNIRTAQMLITHDGITNSPRSDNFYNTLDSLLSLNIVPIINENDSVATEEICFGDNDILSALVAKLIKAEKLIIMTDQLGVLNADPKDTKHAKLIDKIAANNPVLEKVAGKKGGILGKGGMYSKVIAAKTASINNIITHIVYGLDDKSLLKIINNEKVGTLVY